MGFADLSIAEIATQYNLPVERIFQLCEQLGISYQNRDTLLALEDAKAVIAWILSHQLQLQEEEINQKS